MLRGFFESWQKLCVRAHFDKCVLFYTFTQITLFGSEIDSKSNEISVFFYGQILNMKKCAVFELFLNMYRKEGNSQIVSGDFFVFGFFFLNLVECVEGVAIRG